MIPAPLFYEVNDPLLQVCCKHGIPMVCIPMLTNFCDNFFVTYNLLTFASLRIEVPSILFFHESFHQLFKTELVCLWNRLIFLNNCQLT